MARRSLDDRDDDAPRKGGFPVWAMIVIAAAGTTVVGGCAGGVAVVAMWAGATSGPGAGGQSHRQYGREEFRTLLLGKTEGEVFAAVGKPDSTSDSGGKMWVYKNLTIDAVTGKVDPSAFVHFGRDGVVESVNY